MEEIDLSKIFNTLWRRKADIIIIILAFLMIGIIYTMKFVTPLYSSSATMVLVSSNSSDNTITTNDITLNSKLVSTYNKLIKSRNVLKEVISNLKLDIKEEELRKNITVSSLSNTELIEITVKNTNNRISADITNEIAKVFKEKVKEMYNIDNIEIISKAEVEYEPCNINHKKDIIMFVFAGILVAAIYIIIVNSLDTTIKSSEMVEKEFDLPVLASIPMIVNQEKKDKQTGGKE